MLDYLATVPNFIVYLAVSAALLAVFMTIYVWATPQNDLQLIRGGNTSAAVVFSGTLLGFALPMASALTHSVNLVDLVLWGVVAGIVQIAASLLLRTWIGRLHEHIEADRVSVAITMAALKIAFGLLNAAAMVY